MMICKIYISYENEYFFFWEWIFKKKTENRKELQYSKYEMIRLVGVTENGKESWIAEIPWRKKW